MPPYQLQLMLVPHQGLQLLLLQLSILCSYTQKSLMGVASSICQQNLTHLADLSCDYVGKADASYFKPKHLHTRRQEL